LLLKHQLTIGGTFASHGPWLLGGVHSSRGNERIRGTGAVDFPTVVVEEQVMVPTEQDPVRNVGTAMISVPVVDMMSFAPGWWSFAVSETAATISCGKGDALRFGEHALVAADVERLECVVESDF
jgi:hypothetical protein